MSLIYQVIIEYIDDLIEKKHNKIHNIENNTSVILNNNAQNDLCELYRQINVLEICKIRVKGIFSVIQSLE